MTTFSNEVTGPDIRYARIVYACLDPNYAEDRAPIRVRIAKTVACQLIRDAGRPLFGRWDIDDLTIVVPPAEKVQADA
ncbi:hypothetical protein D869_gp248 [Caulobacter phage CcrRogue]|uniref:Uncharacterized protein n=1 Tax=Caulobacter phage CcrRogue TaxID=2927986 RepID=K4JNT2_9CAUD|nr:hypothetical protein D869_gp248 [Caulobacter phage CcrRogue]AFU86666.1 hypothetical protein CcrRogue_gp184 [Caulobacter phage CcrRogue]